MKFPEHKLTHDLLDGFEFGLTIGESAHNPFGLKNSKNVDYTGDMTTVFKLKEIELCGEAYPVDIVAPADDLPLFSNSVDFIHSSHVFEHVPNPIKCILEWMRVIKNGGLIFIIVPLPNALPADVGRPLTSIEHFWEDFQKGYKLERDHPRDDDNPDGHIHIWSYESFKIFIDEYFYFLWSKIPDVSLGRIGLIRVAGEPIDTKVGNGHCHVYRVMK